MNRFSKTLTLAVLAGLVFTLPALAQDRPSFGMADRVGPHGGGGGGLLRCLRGLDLSDSQKADIKALFDAAKPTFDADIAAIKAAREKLDTDYTANAGVSVIGQDYINVRAAANKLKSDGQALQTQVLGNLTSDQQSKAQSCLDAHKGAHARFGRSFD